MASCGSPGRPRAARAGARVRARARARARVAAYLVPVTEGAELLAPCTLYAQREGGAAHGVGGRLGLEYHRAIEPGTLVEGADVHRRHLYGGGAGGGAVAGEGGGEDEGENPSQGER